MNKPVKMLKNFAAANSVIKRSEARKALGLTEPQIDNALTAMVKRGYLSRIGRGMYKSVPVAEKPACEVTEKIWRAMKVKRVFSYSDLAMLADTTREYIYKLFREYRAAKYIKNAGVRKTHGTGTERLFRLTLKGQEFARHPRMENFKPDPLVMDAVDLNRLVCSGLVIKDEAKARAAIVICRRIIDTLQEDMKL